MIPFEPDKACTFEGKSDPLIIPACFYYMSLIEILGFITALAGVWLTTRESVYCWIFNIISSVLYGFFFAELKLYADSALQLFFVSMSFYGWWNWNRKNEQQIHIRGILRREIAACIIITGLAFQLLGYGLSRYTDASLPYLDSFCMVISLCATWLAARKVIHSWFMWIAVDILYVFIYIQKEALLTALLYLLFTALAIAGYIQWKKRTDRIYVK